MSKYECDTVFLGIVDQPASKNLVTQTMESAMPNCFNFLGSREAADSYVDHGTSSFGMLRKKQASNPTTNRGIGRIQGQSANEDIGKHHKS